MEMIAENQQKLAEMLTALRGNPFLTEEEETLIETIRENGPLMSSLGAIQRLVAIVSRVDTLADLRRES